jgi:hypothetical protein
VPSATEKRILRLPPVPSYHQIPRSNALFNRMLTKKSGEPCASVRCGGCERRLFDVIADDVFAGHDLMGYSQYQRQYLLVRQCRHCGTRNFRHVTAQPGIPVGDSGRWACSHCAGYLGNVDAPRGRLTVTCPDSK